MRVPLAILAVLPLALAAQENPFAWDLLPAGKTPPGFRAFSAGTGAAGGWKISEIELPSLLNPNKTLRRKALVHSGNQTDAAHFPALVLDTREFGDLLFKARIRIVGGKTAPAAGLLFAHKDDRNFYITAVRRDPAQVRIAYFENGKLQNGMDAKAAARPDGWVEFALIVRGPLMYLTVNGIAYGELTLGESRPGKIGFWTQADTTCQILDVSVGKPPTLAQQALEDAMQASTDVVELSLAAIPAGKKTAEIVASTSPKEVGKPARDSAAKLLAGGESTATIEGEIAHVAAAIRDVNGKVIAALLVQIKTSTFGNQARYRAHGVSLANKLGERLPSAAKLYE